MVTSFLGRFLYLAVGLVTTVVIATLLIQTRFPHAGWAPAPFVGVDYCFGAGIFLVVNALFRTKSLLRVAALAVVAAAVALMFGGAGPQFLFWLVAVPSAGGVAASISLPRLAAHGPPPGVVDRDAV